MNTYGIRAGYQHREKPDYFHDVQSDGKLWQPQVLPIAVHLARKAGYKRLIDIGCGRGEKITPYMGEFLVAGLDYGENLQYCAAQYPDGYWVDYDLDSKPMDLGVDNTIVVCSDVIEHLCTPEYLVKTLTSARMGNNAVILTTPDRQRVYGYDHNGPPNNVHHTREWTLLELRTFLSAYLPAPAWAGWTLNNNIDREFNTCMLIFGNVDVNGLEALFTLERAA